MTWSGKNTASARQAAASEISTVVQNIQSTSRDEKIFVIGHSHGGSAIASFLKEHSSLAKTLSGCAFLSTPFVAIPPRTQAFRVVSAVFYFPLLTYHLLWSYIFRYSHPDLAPLSHLWPVYYLETVPLAAFTGLLLFNLRKFRNSDKLLKEARRHKLQTCLLEIIFSCAVRGTKLLRRFRPRNSSRGLVQSFLKHWNC